jgi:hypothetical protein
MDSSAQSSLLCTIGAFGGARKTGMSLNTGKFFALKALTDTIILEGTNGNISNLNNAIILQGDTLVGSWTVLNISGDAIIYQR